MGRADEYLSAELQSHYIGCLKDAYATNGDRHDENLGDNALTFGTLTSNTGKYLIEKGLGEKVERRELEVSRPGNSFQVVTDVCTVHFYKYSGDIHSIRFDESVTKILITEANQLLLPLYEDFAAKNERLTNPDGKPPFLYLVVAHKGTPALGLTDVWVGAPKSLGGAGESPWAWVDCIYQRPPGDSPQIEGLPEPEGPSPFSVAPSPAVELRSRANEKTA